MSVALCRVGVSSAFALRDNHSIYSFMYNLNVNMLDLVTQLIIKNMYIIFTNGRQLPHVTSNNLYLHNNIKRHLLHTCTLNVI
jgi:hypothetical protein